VAFFPPVEKPDGREYGEGECNAKYHIAKPRTKDREHERNDKYRDAQGYRSHADHTTAGHFWGFGEVGGKGTLGRFWLHFSYVAYLKCNVLRKKCGTC
jgi:hypothetical protein